MTTLVVKDPVPVEELFRFAQSLLSPEPASQRWQHNGPMTPYVHTNGYTEPSNPNAVWRNIRDQSLPAALVVEYGPNDGPLQLDGPERFTSNEEYEAYAEHNSGFAKVSLATGIGYVGLRGGTCDDLHAWIIEMLCRWLDRLGVRYEWNDVRTDDWFDCAEAVEELGDAEAGRLPHIPLDEG